jgi:energy-coupling factor transporter ATP-binding protein EcfA2
MSEKLIIKHFGPIGDMAFEFQKVNVLIGEQGTGKSTVVKLLAAINSMVSGDSSNMGGAGLMRKDQYGSIEHLLSHLKVFNIQNYLGSSTYIKYSNTYFDVEVKEKSCLTIPKKIPSGYSVHDFFSAISTTFIPADRNAVSLFSSEVLFALNEIDKDLPTYFLRFGRLYNRLKKNEQKFDFSGTLGVNYLYKENRDVIYLKDGKEINMQEASSAIQTNIPLLIILKHQADVSEKDKDSDLALTVIEEPELNSFPKLQYEIVQYILACIRRTNKHYFRRCFITTHSPYILTSLNNLIFANEIGQAHKKETSEILPEKYWLSYGDVAVYKLKDNGRCENILDNELRQINVEKIDEISEQLSAQWHQLAELNVVVK